MEGGLVCMRVRTILRIQGGPNSLHPTHLTLYDLLTEIHVPDISKLLYHYYIVVILIYSAFLFLGNIYK